MVNCPHCHGAIAGDAAFCPLCGAALRTPGGVPLPSDLPQLQPIGPLPASSRPAALGPPPAAAVVPMAAPPHPGFAAGEVSSPGAQPPMRRAPPVRDASKSQRAAISIPPIAAAQPGPAAPPPAAEPPPATPARPPGPQTQAENVWYGPRTLEPPSDNRARLSAIGPGVTAAVAAPPELPGDALVGQVIDERYRVQAMIGEGGMGAVYKVEHVKLNKLLAMKVLRPEYSHHPELRRRFNREAEAASRLMNIHTVTVTDFGETPDKLLYLVMELLVGESMAAAITREKRLDPRRVAMIGIQMCESLSEAHGHGIVHRDVKPDNVFLTGGEGARTEIVKILDFGVAKLSAATEDARQTQFGMVVGSPHYMSPEQLRGKEIDLRSDIYAAGATLYEALCGCTPYDGTSVMEIAEEQNRAPLRPPTTRVPEDVKIPHDFEGVIMRAMARTPERRYESATELQTALSQALKSMDATAAAFAPLPPEAGAPQPWAVQEPPRKNWAARIFMTLVVLGAMGYAGLLGYERYAPARPNTVEVEPNDEPNHATPLTPEVTISGAISAGADPAKGDEDLYVFDVPAATGRRQLNVQVGAVEGLDLKLEVFRYDDASRSLKLIKRVKQNGVGQGEALPNLGVDPGRYYVRVSEDRAPGQPPLARPDVSYTLDARLLPPARDLALEPNDDNATATPTRLGDSARGYLGGPDDVDVFAVNVPEGAAPTALLRFTPPGQADGILTITDTSGKVLRSVDAAGPGAAEAVNVRLTDLGAPFFVRVTIKGPGSASETYSLDLGVQR